MAFWNKRGEDPWDLPREEPQNSFQEYVDQWNAVIEREKADQEAKKKAREDYENAPFPQAASMDCPWCGQTMDRVYFYGGRYVPALWRQTVGRNSFGWEVPADTPWGYKSAWYCPKCQRMVMELKRPYDYRKKEE